MLDVVNCNARNLFKNESNKNVYLYTEGTLYFIKHTQNYKCYLSLNVTYLHRLAPVME